ncbi:MAG TPA: hypothetical protein VHS34_17360 [Terriglobales bacterium]|nr:hypothetical protein [Terriglobales bacterium]
MRSMRLAVLAVATTLAFSGLALARDHDYWKDKHVNNHHEVNHVWDHARSHDTYRSNSHWWEGSRQREREHERWEREHRNDGYYGNSRVYNRYPSGGYGYPNGGYGYPAGGYGYPNGGYGNPGTVYGRGGYGGYGGYGGSSSSAGYRQGMQDGSYQARKDIAEGKPFNPNPRGSSHSDHGYHSSMGDKYQYQASYNQGYHSGYQANYGGGRGGNRGWGF